MEGWEIMSSGIAERLNNAIAAHGIIIESTYLRDVVLPPKLMDAIKAKQQAEQ